MAYTSLARPGLRTTQTINPDLIIPEVSDKIVHIAPEATPLITLGEKLGYGAPPKTHKPRVIDYYETDQFDQVTAVVAGTGTETRFQNWTMANRSRPTTGGAMFYQPQDKFCCITTGQIFEVIITEDAAMKRNGADMTLSTGLTGNTTNRSAAGTIVVRVVEAVPAIAFTSGDVVYLGRSISESQDIEASSYQRDPVFDFNYVEHKEKVFICNEDQRNLIQTVGKFNDFTFQQEQTLLEMKKEVEYNAMFSERAINYDRNNVEPTRHMRGLIPSIKTNVTVYDPTAITPGNGFELLVSQFMNEQAFRYNGQNRENRKIALCGPRFLHNFGVAFANYRRMGVNNERRVNAGFVVESYYWQGFTLDLIRTDVLRQGTKLQDWCVVIDPKFAEWRIKKRFETRFYQLPTERKMKFMVEWQGTIAWHAEEHHALLRTA